MLQRVLSSEPAMRAGRWCGDELDGASLSPPKRAQRAALRMSDFILGPLLGKGAFGKARNPRIPSRRRIP